MDLTNSSLSSRATISVNGRRGSELTQTEEVLEEWRDGREREQQREVERETEVNDGIALAAETPTNHRVAADKNKFHTAGRQRKPKQKLVSDFATVSKGAAGNVKPRPALIHVLFNQGPTDKSSMPEERDQLDMLKEALKAFPVPACLSWTWGKNGTEATLENKWTDIIPSHVTMSKNQRHQQEALWELIHTELSYINKLTIITDLVMAVFTYLQQNGFLEVKPEQIFSNLPSILNAHRLFWQDVIYPMLLEARKTGMPFDPLSLEAGCMQLPQRFSPYLQYCWEEERAVELARSLTDTSLNFQAYVLWVESHPLCGRMRLGDMQAKPHQRITKYPLLLKAILKNTQDPPTQLALREMLASVNGFLESINNYLRLKGEEMALSVSAQRIEGYSRVDGMNEEIDKLVKTICSFNLMCPIRGVGLGVIRKLLFEGHLKIRGRKDNKMEVIALLFSDVLLITKAQKKAERLKVVRPPMALERIHCDALKDSCSFVLVEVSVLGCAVDVHTFSTNNPDNCTTWISIIKQAQDDLRDLREIEASRKLQIQKRDVHLQEDFKHPAEPKLTKEELVNKQKVTDIIPSANGTLASVAPEAKKQTQKPLDKFYKDAMLPEQIQKVLPSQTIHGGSRVLVKKNGHGGGRVMNRVVVLEAGLRDDGDINQLQEEVESTGIKERRVTWNHSRHSNSQPQEATETNQPQPNGPLEGYPEVDYLPNTSSTSPFSTSTENNSKMSITVSQLDVPGFPSQGSTSAQRLSHPQTVNVALGKDPGSTQSVEDEASAELQRFSRKLKSPRLRRRRLINSQQASGPPSSRRGSESSGKPQYVPRRSSSSNSDSNYSFPGLSRQSSVPPVVLNLGSVTKNKGVFWEQPAERDFSPESHTFSDTENSQKRPSKKTQRSASIPDNYQGRYGRVQPSVRHSDVRIAPSPPPGLDSSLHPSPVEALLDRAKERKKDGGKREEKGTWNPSLELPPSVPISPSQSPSDGEEEWKEVELVRCWAPTVSQRWTEEGVDGEEEETKISPTLPNGASVDWSRYNIDDDEILDQTTPEASGVGVDEETYLISDGSEFNRFMNLRDSLRIARLEDRFISHV
ncbi:hypothetical protein UPYG_G00153040 [Umbra pygmaea]|uniref:Pleckstrin homology domain-containing family G member 6 n=1 Tax=Umbra pygmaea TaxID=75934 RepID=A0ABD0WYN5_UMBPY